MRELGVIPIEADYTNRDPRIFAVLKKFDRLGPPLDLIYPAGKLDEPIVLPILFDKSEFLDKLAEAGPSKDAPGADSGS